MRRGGDSLRALCTSVFLLCLLTAVLPTISLSPHRLHGSSAITKRAVPFRSQFSSASPDGIKSHRNDAEGCHALPWFGGYVAVAVDSGCSAYAYSQHQEPLSLWNPEAGNGRSPPSHVPSSQL